MAPFGNWLGLVGLVLTGWLLSGCGASERRPALSAQQEEALYIERECLKWQRLQVGMDIDEVENLIGPVGVVSSDVYRRLAQERGSLSFGKGRYVIVIDENAALKEWKNNDCPPQL